MDPSGITHWYSILFRTLSTADSRIISTAAIKRCLKPCQYIIVSLRIKVYIINL